MSEERARNTRRENEKLKDSSREETNLVNEDETVATSLNDLGKIIDEKVKKQVFSLEDL